MSHTASGLLGDGHGLAGVLKAMDHLYILAWWSLMYTVSVYMCLLHLVLPATASDGNRPAAKADR
jgi:hypothetical protein